MDGILIAITAGDKPIAISALERLGLTELTDGAGRYRFERIPPGTYNILIGRKDPPIYHPGAPDLGRATAIQVVAGSTIEVPEMVVYGVSVRGRVVDMDTGKGRRIENLVLCCDYFKQVQLPRYFGGPSIGSAFTATISDDGSFIFPSVPPGNYALSTADEHFISVSWALAVGPNGVTGLQLEVTEGVEVQGTVVDQTGRPVSASVQLRPQPADSVFSTIGPPVNTDLRGTLLAVNPSRKGSSVTLRRLGIPRADPTLQNIQDRILEIAKMSVRSQTPGPDGRFVFRVYPGT